MRNCLKNQKVNLGNLFFNNGKRKDAETSYLEALRLTQEVGDKVEAGKDYTYLGNLQFKDGSFDKAEGYFDLAIENFRDVNSMVNLIQLCLTVARMEIVVSRRDEGDKYLDKAREISKLIGDLEPITKAIADLEKFKDQVDKK